jgi:pimeloyl-ACP methyl ester carboxylesterase
MLIAVDEIGAPVDLIGLCQGGWLALVYAARFPEKVRRLVLAGAPIDIRAGHSQLSRMAVDAPAAAFETLVDRGGGLVLGRDVLALWAPALAADDVPRILQVPVDIDRDRLRELEMRFAAWYAWTLDMPGTRSRRRMLFTRDARARPWSRRTRSCSCSPAWMTR